MPLAYLPAALSVVSVCVCGLFVVLLVIEIVQGIRGK